MAVRHTEAVQQLSSAARRTESCPSVIGPISLEVKQMGAPGAGNPHAACDAEGLQTWLGRDAVKGVRRELARQSSTLPYGEELETGPAARPGTAPAPYPTARLSGTQTRGRARTFRRTRLARLPLPATLCIAAYGFLVSDRERIPPHDLVTPLGSKNLPFPKVINPEAPPPRTERQVPNSIATMRRRLIIALVSTLSRCPCCATPVAKGSPRKKFMT